MKISKHEYETWLKDPMTIKFVEFLKTTAELTRNDLLDSNFLMETTSDKEIGYKIGHIDCIHTILFEVFQQQEEESQDDTNTTTFRP
jgi:hypothetical protein